MAIKWNTTSLAEARHRRFLHAVAIGERLERERRANPNPVIDEHVRDLFAGIVAEARAKGEGRS